MIHKVIKVFLDNFHSMVFDKASIYRICFMDLRVMDPGQLKWAYATLSIHAKDRIEGGDDPWSIERE